MLAAGRSGGRLPGDRSCCSLAARPRRGVPPAGPPPLAGPSSARSLSSVAKLTSDRLPSAEAGAHRNRAGSGSGAAGRSGGQIISGSPGPPWAPSRWVLPGKLRLPLFTRRGAGGWSRRLHPAQVVWRCRLGRGTGHARSPAGRARRDVTEWKQPLPSFPPPQPTYQRVPWRRLPGARAAAGAVGTGQPPAPRCGAWPSAGGRPGCLLATCSPELPVGAGRNDRVRRHWRTPCAPLRVPTLSPCCSSRR